MVGENAMSDVMSTARTHHSGQNGERTCNVALTGNNRLRAFPFLKIIALNNIIPKCLLEISIPAAIYHFISWKRTFKATLIDEARTQH